MAHQFFVGVYIVIEGNGYTGMFSEKSNQSFYTHPKRGRLGADVEY